MTNTRDITDFRYNENRNIDWTLLSSLVNTIDRVCYQRSSLELDIIQSLLKHDYVNNQEGVELWWYDTREDQITKDLIRNFDNKEYKNSIEWFMEDNLYSDVFKLEIDRDTKELFIVSVKGEEKRIPFIGKTNEYTLRLPHHNCYDEHFLYEIRKRYRENWRESAREFERILQEEAVDTYEMVETLLVKYPNITLQVVEKECDTHGSKRIEEVVGIVKNDVGFKYLITKQGERLDASRYVVYNYGLISLLMQGAI